MLALAALGWVLESEERAARYLELTGLDPDSLRAGLADPMILASPLEFLANHEPDLIRAADQHGQVLYRAAPGGQISKIAKIHVHVRLREHIKAITKIKPATSLGLAVKDHRKARCGQLLLQDLHQCQRRAIL